MPVPRTPLARILEFVAAHGDQLVVDGNLCVRLNQDGLEVLPADADLGENEQEVVVTLRLLLPHGLNLLRPPPGPPIAPHRNEHGWTLDAIWYQSPTFVQVWMREKAAFDPRVRGGLTGDRLVMVFKLINTIVGYQNKFAESTRKRLGYWRAVLTQGGAPLPPLWIEIPGPAANPHLNSIRRLLTVLLNLDRRRDVTRLSERIIYYEIHREFRRLTYVLVGQGHSEREASRLAGEEIVLNLPVGVAPTSWKTISTCAKNWYTYMNAFGGLVGAWFFPEDEVVAGERDSPLFTHNAFGTHLSLAERDVLLELIRVLLPDIQALLQDSPLAQLAHDIFNTQHRAHFDRLDWEDLPKGIQHFIPLLAGQPIINWRHSENADDWQRVNPIPVVNPGPAPQVDGCLDVDDMEDDRGAGIWDM